MRQRLPTWATMRRRRRELVLRACADAGHELAALAALGDSGCGIPRACCQRATLREEKKKKKKKNTKRYDEGEEDGGDDRAAVPVSDQRDASNASRTDTEAQVPAAKRKRCCARRGSESTSPDAEHLLQRFPLPSPPRPPPRSLPVPPPAPQLTGGHLEQPPPPLPQLDNTSRRWQPSLGPPSWWRSSSAAGSSWPASSWQSSASSSRWRHW